MKEKVLEQMVEGGKDLSMQDRYVKKGENLKILRKNIEKC
jgi:hypothetical protein